MAPNIRHGASLRSLLSGAGIALAYFTASAGANPLSNAQQPIGAPTAKIGQEVVTGTIWSMEESWSLPVEVEAFLGIRYGQAPTGDLRFRPSKLAKGFSAGNIDASHYGWGLSAFGFLGSKIAKDDNSLNAGLHDQILLLEWLQENIEAFGGDPNKVTLMGVSAGAHSIGHLLMYENGDKPLFHRAILEDGAPTARLVSPYDDELVEAQFEEFITQVGCKGSGDQVMNCLRQKDASIILSASNSVFNRYYSSNRWAFQPVIDGDIIPQQPVKAWEDGQWKKMPIITGFTTDEGTIFVPKHTATNQEFVNYMKALVPKMSDDHVKEMQRLYPDPLTDPSSPYKDTRPVKALGLGPQFKRLAAAYGQFAYVCPVRDTAIQAKKTSSEPVFLYHFAANKSIIDGAPHAMITEYETFTPSAWACPRALDHEKCKWSQMTTAGIFHDYLCSFIVTGDPNKAEMKWKAKPEWKQYQPGGGNNVMWFAKDSDDRAGGSSSGTPAVMADDDFAAENCKVWWDVRPLTE
ncbi:hypothetical protein KEM56_002544 [Ascosphaera pollenicola]|nr:hypothetical protein KEM56_002544 [Ascosphaera pollenicola]